MDSIALLEQELASGEEIFWYGNPTSAGLASQKAAEGKGGTIAAVFGGIWLLFVLGMFALGASEGAPAFWLVGIGFMSLFGLFFVSMALKMAAAPGEAAARAPSTMYAVTNTRLVILDAGRGVQSFGPQDLQRIERREHEDGTGDVIFARERIVSQGRSYRVQEIGFFGVQNPREVERLIREHLLS